MRIHTYRAYRQDRAPLTRTRSGCFAYWSRAKQFEKAATTEGRHADAAFQKSIRIQYENYLLEMDAAESGNI